MPMQHTPANTLIVNPAEAGLILVPVMSLRRRVGARDSGHERNFTDERTEPLEHPVFGEREFLPRSEKRVGGGDGKTSAVPTDSSESHKKKTQFSTSDAESNESKNYDAMFSWLESKKMDVRGYNRRFDATIAASLPSLGNPEEWLADPKAGRRGQLKAERQAKEVIRDRKMAYCSDGGEVGSLSPSPTPDKKGSAASKICVLQ